MGNSGMLTSVRLVMLPLVAGVASIAYVNRAGAQGATASATLSGPAVNELAPDFSLAGADRYGLLKNPVRLSDYRGRTVVLAFFYQARTKG